MLKSPGFAAVIVLTLGLGIGANTAIFSVVNAVLLRPLPYSEPERLVTITHFYPSLNNLEAGFAAPTFRDVGNQGRIFDGVAVQSWWQANLTGKGEPERLTGSLVSGDFFSTLGVSASHGRTILSGEAEPGRDRVVVLSHGIWRRLFGEQRDAVGQTVQLNGESYQIVGVMPANFRDLFHQNAEFWVPLTISPSQYQARTNEYLAATARLKPGVTLEQAQREMAAFAERLKADNPGSYPADWTLRTFSLDEKAKGNIRPALLVLLGAVGLVLLIACANVTNLLLARSAVRTKEVAIRSALGAKRADLVRQLLTESLLLSLLGGALALLLAYGGIRLLTALNPTGLAGIEGLGIDGTAMLFTLGIAVLTSLLFGVVPALKASRTDLQGTLKEGGRTDTSDAGGQMMRKGLVVAEVALALMLLVGAGLLIRSFAHLQQVDPGFTPDNVVTASIALPDATYGSDTAQVAFFDAVLSRIAAIPGVRSVGATSAMPFSGNTSNRSFMVEGLELGENQPAPWGEYRLVDPNFHRTMGIPLIRGRFFSDSDRQGSPRVAVIDQELANRYWPNQDPIGKRLAFPPAQDQEPNWIEVVGVVGHTAHSGLDAERKVQLYRPYRQAGTGFLNLAVRTTGDPMRSVGAIRAAVRSVDPNQPIADVKTMQQLMDSAVGQRRFSMILLGLFAGIALLLASIGIYGVMSFDVARRGREMGLRIALGAERGSVMREVMQRGVSLTLIGVGLGLVGALLLSRLIASQLYGIGSTDPLTFVAVALLLAGVAVLATLVPAWRATRVDPMVALRAE
jgi:putative ABC transport system permease protein